MQKPKPGSRHLYAGYRLVSKQVSPRLVPRNPCTLGFDIIVRGFDASSNGIAFARLPGPYLTSSLPRLFRNAHHLGSLPTQLAVV